METIQNALSDSDYGWALGKRSQEKQRFVEANQRRRIGEAGGVETIQQLYYACGFVASEAVAGGFEFGELAVENIRNIGPAN